jgi:hypothetical protein
LHALSRRGTEDDAQISRESPLERILPLPFA